MLKINIVAVGKIKEKFWQTAIAEYVKRLRPYAKLEIVEVLAESFSSQNKRIAQTKENERLMKALEKYNKQNVYLLAETGKEFDSLQFAKFITKQSEIVLVIGGALGWAEEIKKQYPQTISLSQLTMPHEMARVVLLEQIYRAVSIINGKEYHY